MNEESPICIKYQPVFKDFRALNLYVLFRGPRLAALIIGGAALVIFASTSWVDSSNEGVASAGQRFLTILTTLSPLLVILLIMPMLLYWMMRRRWNTAEELRTAREYEMDDAGVRVKGALFQGFMDWKLFKFADFKGGHFFLRTGQRTYYYIPAAAVPNRKAFLELIARNVKVSKRWENALIEQGAS